MPLLKFKAIHMSSIFAVEKACFLSAPPPKSQVASSASELGIILE